MTKYETYEIVQMYKEAADKNKQIKILAELNCCSEKDIVNILVEEGVISGVKPINKNTFSGDKIDKRQSERGKWTEERLKELQGLLDEGLEVSKIAERMGENKQCIHDAIRKYIKGNKTAKKAVPAKKEQMSTEKQNVVSLSKYVTVINRIDDMRAAAVVAKDICNIICMFSEQEMEDYESTVQTLVYSVGELLNNVINKGSENVE